jgi:hypothetical protein
MNENNATQSSLPVNTNEIMPKLPEAEKKLTKTFNFRPDFTSSFELDGD